MILEILDRIKKNATAVEDFFKSYEKRLKPSPFISCDIRNSGEKIAVIDTNIFPGGFNNLCKVYSQDTISAFDEYLSQYYPNAQRLVLLTEEHTRNKFYMENVLRLKTILEKTGRSVDAAYLGNSIQEESILIQFDDGDLTLKRLFDSQGKLNFDCDLILSNNDFSSGLDPNLENCPVPIIPSPGLGWYKRRKSSHFALLQNLVEEFSRILSIDPKRLYAFFSQHDKINFSDSENLNQLSVQTDQVLKLSKEFYEQNKIQDDPYVFIKNDSGTYGMGMITASSGEEVLQINRKTRNKILSSKGDSQVTAFIIQEGIPTNDTYSEFPIEPVIYMVGFRPVGGFFRINPSKDERGNLNSKGMMFSCLCLHKLDEPHEEQFIHCEEKSALIQVSIYLARLAAIAVAQEWQQIS